MNRCIRSISQVVGQPFGQCGADVASARKHAPDGPLQFFRHALFGEVTGRASFEGPPGVLLFGVHAEEKDRQLWTQSPQVLQDIEAASSGHANVKNDDIPILLAHTLDRFLCRVCFPEGHFGKCFADGLPEPAAKDGMIIGNQHSHLKPCPGGGAGGSGIRTVMVVPTPGTPSTLSSPLSKSARSCIPTRPRDLRALASPGSKPLPLS